MSDDKQIHELAKLMTGNNDLRAEIMGSIKKIFQDKYINKINHAVKAQYSSVQSNPSREIRLMSAMKDFYPESRQDNIDKIINLLTVMNTYQSVRTNLNEAHSKNINAMSVQPKSIDESIHDDGIYDIDAACFIKNETKRADVLSALMMLVFMGNEKL